MVILASADGNTIPAIAVGLAASLAEDLDLHRAAARLPLVSQELTYTLYEHL